MKKIYIECDGCGKEIKNNPYFIDIYQKEDSSGRLTIYGAVLNLQLNNKKIIGKESTYCKTCIDKVIKFIDNLGETNGIHNNSSD